MYFNHDIARLIYYGAPITEKYLHKKIGFTRFYNPGAMCVPYEYELYEVSTEYKAQEIKSLRYYRNQSPEGGFCEEARSPDGVYYEKTKGLPGYPDVETGDYNAIGLPKEYVNAPVMLVYIQNNLAITKTMYFVFADGTWWLAVIDDCDCSA